MSKRKSRSLDEWENAIKALDYAAEVRGVDDEEYMRRFELVPKWAFDEFPELREQYRTQVLPMALAALKTLASEGNEEAATTLFDVLSQYPDLQGVLPATPHRLSNEDDPVN